MACGVSGAGNLSVDTHQCHIKNGNPSLSFRFLYRFGLIVLGLSYVKCQLSADVQSNSIFLFFPLAFSAAMSDNVSLAEQATCVDSESEDDWYTIDIFSHVQTELDENNVSYKQLFLYVTRAGVNRRTFLQVHNLLRELGWYKNVAECTP